MKNCHFCKGPVEQRRIEHVHNWKGHLYIFRNVPAEVCIQCGEVFFAPQALKAMDDVTDHDRKPDEHHSVPVYSL